MSRGGPQQIGQEPRLQEGQCGSYIPVLVKEDGGVGQGGSSKDEEKRMDFKQTEDLID